MIQVTESGFVRLSDIIKRKEVTPAEAEANRAALAAAVASGDKKAINRAKSKPRTARRGSTGMLSISRSSWLAGVKDGRFPQPVKLAPRTTVWRVEDVLALIKSVK